MKAQDWLEQEEEYIDLYKAVDYNEINEKDYLSRLSTLMERYKNNETREYEVLILQFYIKLIEYFFKDKQKMFDYLMDKEFKEFLMFGESYTKLPKELFATHPLTQMYKDHFGITEQRMGEIKKEDL